jgi:hypothetical protein
LPVRWIKSGHTVGFVPIHPYDIAGRPPVNSRNGVFTVDPKGPHPIERMALQAGRKIDILNEPPRAFRTDFAPPLARAEAPHMVAHEIKDFSVARSGLAKASGIPITFDHRSQTFMMSHEVMQGGRSVSVTAPIGGREGGLQSRGYYGGGAASGGGAGWRGGSNAGSNAGGGARSGSQGASSGNGGYHGGGGSVSSGSSSAGSSGGASSSAGSSGGSGASSSGGGHH